MTTWLLVILLFQSSACWAHVFPVQAEPRVGATVRTPPAQVSILFDGDVEPVFSAIRVENKEKAEVDKKDSHIDPKDPHTLAVSLRPDLPSGEYHVDWSAVARDGHRTRGQFSFRIEDPEKRE